MIFLMSNNQISVEEKNMLRKIFWRSWTLFGSFNMVKMQGYGYCQAMIPVINEFYKDKEEDKRKALVRSSTFFNCTYETAPFIMGLNAAMEKANSSYPDFDTESINAVKASLMGPLSGIGDSIFWGTVRLIASGIGISLAMQGNIFGPLLFLLIYHIPSIIARYELLNVGYTAGERFLKTVYNSGAFENLTYCATMVGMIMIGAMTAQFVTISTPLKFAIGANNTLVIQDILDSIMPGILPLTVTLLTFYFIRKKVKISYLLLGIILLGLAGSFIGIF